MEIRPRRATEIVDASFQLLRRFYSQFVTVSALCMAPGVVYRIVERDAMSNPQLMVAHPSTFAGVAIVIGLSFIVCDAVLTVAVSQAYLDGTIDLASAFGAGMRRFGWVLLASIFRGLLIVLVIFVTAMVFGVLSLLKTPVLFALLVPLVIWLVLYVVLRTFALTPIVLLERVGPNAAMARTLHLTKNSAAHVLFSLGLAWVLYFIVSAIVSVLGVTLLTPTTAGIIGAFLIIPIYPLLAVVSTLVYYDLRIRKEGFDLEIMSRELGAAPAPAA